MVLRPATTYLSEDVPSWPLEFCSSHERQSKASAVEHTGDAELRELAISKQLSSVGNGRRQAVSGRPIVG